MNYIFISPYFPHIFWQFCDCLKKDGINVLSIGDASYDSLEGPLKSALTEYYKVDNLEDYDQVYRAVAFFAFKYGKIDWIESMNEYWLEQDARLRTDFNVTTGIQTDRISIIKNKSEMKKVYQDAGIPTARQSIVTTRKAGLKFIDKVGYPVIVKPDNGVGANDTWKIENDSDLNRFYDNLPQVPYVMEEFIEDGICSYDAIVDSNCDPIFESMTVWVPVMNVVNDNIDLRYYTRPDMDEKLSEIGRKTVKAFDVGRRFVHLEFFCLDKPRKGLGGVGDYVALEVNMRPAGGYTPDMMNFAHSTNVYQIYADMVAYDSSNQTQGPHYYCVYAGRKDEHTFTHSHEEVMARYGADIVMQEEMPQLYWRQMGRVMYTARFKTLEETEEFITFVQG